MKDALRSGDLFVPQSKQHVSFWELMLDQHHWQATREAAYVELQQPTQENVKTALILEFHQIAGEAEKRFELDSFAEIRGGVVCGLNGMIRPKFLRPSPDCKRS
ncbi:hypothetical protein O185_24290 [Photorhabdus temperata J3]|uniref:Uncharacterized protein n=2 Tax=Photorhabdus temperata TaxID=574560 RepID=U7QRE0_PHOTE|nr:hypothetical protein [Photorhabdus temperata]ERT10534.1 hypothetical protein O185_24290 [Photorhabdus temperata J3]